jgi:hypothetical protein
MVQVGCNAAFTFAGVKRTSAGERLSPRTPHCRSPTGTGLNHLKRQPGMPNSYNQLPVIASTAL